MNQPNAHHYKHQTFVISTTKQVYFRARARTYPPATRQCIPNTQSCSTGLTLVLKVEQVFLVLNKYFNLMLNLSLGVVG